MSFVKRNIPFFYSAYFCEFLICIALNYSIIRIPRWSAFRITNR